MVGLKGLTDPDAALQNFRSERGDDPTPAVPVLHKVSRRASGISGGAICGIAAGGGFVFGLVLMLVLSACLSRRASRY